MFKRVSLLLLGLVCGLPLAFGQQGQAPEWKYGLEFRVRKAGEPDFTKDTQRFGAEVFVDRGNNQGLLIDEGGGLSSLKTPPAGGKDILPPKWQHALEVKVRKAGEADFTDKTKKYSMEVFRDENSGHWVYICETGAVAAVPATTGPTTGEPKAPKFLHGLELKVRKGGEADFTKDTKRYGIEVFRDENNGNLVYITETGAIAVVPGAAPPPGETKQPKWLHGLEFRVRKADEPDFTKDTRNFGAEIYKDENTNQLIYIVETGALAVVPAGSISGGSDTKPPKWTHGLVLKCRKAGEADFTKDTKRFGVEVFQDPNTGMTVYITETGTLAVPAK
jgi:hypothetical protein